MEKDKMSETRNIEWIASVEERLRWFLEEATDEEFDAEEVDTLVSLLNRLKPLDSVEFQSDEEALAKFHEYAKLRDAEEPTNATVSEKEVIREGKVSKKHKSRNRLRYFVKNHKLVSAVAAILLVILVAGGSMGAVNANKGNGFFYWLQKDDEGMTMLTSPESMNGEMLVGGTQEYYSMEEVPGEYQKYLVNKDRIGQLLNYELQKVTITESDNRSRMIQWFSKDSGETNMYFGVMIYEDAVQFAHEIHLSKEIQAIDSEQLIGEEILLRENVPGMKEGKIFFYKENIKYFVEGNIESELLIQMAEAYRDLMLNN